jgi:hypothetical protein
MVLNKVSTNFSTYFAVFSLIDESRTFGNLIFFQIDEGRVIDESRDRESLEMSTRMQGHISKNSVSISISFDCEKTGVRPYLSFWKLRPVCETTGCFQIFCDM